MSKATFIQEVTNPPTETDGSLRKPVINTGDAVAADVAAGKVFSSAGLTNAEGTGLVPENTGDAVAADVASGKTFSSSALTNATGTSTKNATVPVDAKILPAQTFVDALEAVIAAKNLNFSAFALNTASQDNILSWLAALNVSNGVLDLSGGAELPTPAVAHINGSWEITITGTPVGSITLADNNAHTANPTFGTDVDVTSADASTIAGLLADYINGLANAGWNAVAVGGVVTVTVTPDAGLPLTAGTDAATNLTIADTAGVAFVQNADKTTLEGNGWTVTTN